MSASYSGASYVRGYDGIVHLSGVVRAEALGSNVLDCSNTSGPIFVLPAGYRPPVTHIFAISTTGDTLGRIEIAADGGVRCKAGSTARQADANLSLSGIDFPAAR